MNLGDFRAIVESPQYLATAEVHRAAASRTGG